MRPSPLILLFPLLAPLGSSAWGEEGITPDQLDFFETEVRPSLVKYCYECHSVEAGESRGGLYLDTREGMREGGSTGPLFDTDNWEYSLFVDAITWADSDFEMPPKQKMPSEVIEALKRWVQMGAPDPRARHKAFVKSEIDYEAGKEHWAYKRPIRPEGKSIDEIVEEGRAAEGLSAVGAADALSLLRRLNFDLTGLPPTPPEVKAFQRAYEENPKQAVAVKVEQLLASEHYGERWGRHWLDVVRFGESAGTMNVVYPYAWRFRNYVIDSFNRDKPYDRLITEHLAGDLLSAASDEERQELLIATGYLAVGPKKQNEKNRQQFASNLIDEQIDTTTRGFMATTVACARCHDHKFDPISTGDYYAMAGIFGSTETLWGTIAGNQNHRTTELLSLPIADPGQSAANQGNEYEQKQRQLAELIQKNNTLRGRTGKGGKKGNQNRDEDRKALLEANGMEARDLVRLKQQIMRLQSELKFLNPDGSAKTYAMGAREGEVANATILVSGDINRPAQEVERGFPQVLRFEGAPVVEGAASGRLELAEWIVSRENPLTARVMVNRIWMHLTGKPIVETMDNFGSTGLPPSNPELLDYLAVRFMEKGWSIKELVREIALSDTYQLASTFDEGSYAKDPDNTTHWRANARQLDAESLRDQMLLVSGQLDRLRPVGSMTQGISDARVGGGRRDSSAAFNTAEIKTRSLYLPMFREAMTDELALFDAPDPIGTVGQRSATNVAPQSLHLMNSELVNRQAESMAEVLERNFKNTRDQVANAFLLAYSRPASQEEVARGLQFLSEFEPGDVVERVVEPVPSPSRRREQGSGGGAESAPEAMAGRPNGKGAKNRKRGQAPAEALSQDVPRGAISKEQVKLAALCQALMMSAEFRMIH